MKNSENKLLKASREANMTLDLQGLQNWHKIVRFLLEITNLQPLPNQNNKEDERMINTFKKNIKSIYQNWWYEETISVKNSKLNFLSKYKKRFKFEPYLDILPRHIRLYTSRLRTSSHNYPIETLRYCEPYIDPQDRKCNICDSNETGDEHHYLLKCTNQNIINTRQTFLTNIKNTTNQFKDFKDECIIQYCLLLHDQKVIQETAEFIKAVAITYREELEERKEETITITRSGRLVKKPDKLNL